MRSKFILFLIGVMILSGSAFASGINVFFNENAIKDNGGSTLSDNNYHNYKVRLEFYHGSLPSPKVDTGRLPDTSVQPFYTKGAKHKYQLSSLNGGTLNVRVWKDSPSGTRQGNYYGKASHAVASGTTLPYDWTITELKTEYLADVPYAPSIGSISESMVRDGDNLNLKLVVPVSYDQTGPDGKTKIEANSFSVTVTYPSGGAPVPMNTSYNNTTAQHEITLNDTESGTYKFKPTATNWYGSTDGSEITYTTLGAGGGGSVQQEVTLAFTKATDGFGINFFVVPFPMTTVFREDGTSIATVQDLIDTINVTGEGYAATVGYWDTENQLEVGFSLGEEGNVLDKINTTEGPADVNLDRAKAYQVSVTENKIFTVRNY